MGEVRSVLWLFFEGFHGWAVSAPLVTSRTWHVYSETLRAEYGGSNRATACQIMAAIAVYLSSIGPFALPEHSGLDVSLVDGLAVPWPAGARVSLDGIWVALFLFVGRSTWTGAFIKFHVHADRIWSPLAGSGIE